MALLPEKRSTITDASKSIKIYQAKLAQGITEIPSGPPPQLDPMDGPANSWIPPQEPISLDQAMQIGCGMIGIERCSEKDVGALMGKAWRNPITGVVQIKAYGGFQDFIVADLWTRPSLNGAPGDLAGDPYLFRPIPMNTRTWMYHHFFRIGKLLEGVSGAEEDAMIRYILAMHCIDAHVSGGRWAPMVLYVPMILFLTLAADINAAMASIVVLVIIGFIQWVMNTPELYRWPRAVHFPIRLVLLIWIIQRMGAKADTASGASMLGFVIALLFCFGELILGDGGALCAYRLHCSYEVIRPLPNRIFVCRRWGAAHSKDILGRCLPVNEKITGMGSWEEDYALIADVKGLIVELRPMGIQDWKLVFQEKQTNLDVTHRYIGLDVYSPGAATIDALSNAIEEQQMMMAKNQQRKQWAQDDVRMEEA